MASSAKLPEPDPYGNKKHRQPFLAFVPQATDRSLLSSRPLQMLATEPGDCNAHISILTAGQLRGEIPGEHSRNRGVCFLCGRRLRDLTGACCELCGAGFHDGCYTNSLPPAERERLTVGDPIGLIFLCQRCRS